MRLFPPCRFGLGVGLTVLLCGPSSWPQAPSPVGASTAPAGNPTEAKKAKKEYEAARRAEEAGDWSAAFEGYAQAATLWPGNTEYRLRRELARFQLVQQHVNHAERDAVAGKLDEAQIELRAALALDPSYSVARERLQQIEGLAQRLPVSLPAQVASEVQIQPAPGKRNFDFRGDVQGAYEEVGRQFGLTATFDSDLRSRQIRFRVADVDFSTAMRLLGELTHTFWRPVNAHLFLVAERTPQKRRDYAPSVLKTVVLPESETPDQMTETLRLVREIAGITRAQLDLADRTITMRAEPDDIALALNLIRQVEQPHGELMLEIEILEVDRNAARRLGLTPPTSAQVFTISPSDIRQAQQSVQALLQVLTRLFGQPSSLAGLTPDQIGALLGSGQLGVSALIPPVVAFGGGRTTFLATLPGAVAEFSDVLQLVRRGRRVLLRVQDGQPATFFVGDRFPIALALLSPSLGAAQFVPTLSTANFPRVDLVTGSGPVSVAAADFNGDSRVDLAVADQTANTVSVILNNGGGRFAAHVDYPTGRGPAAVAAGDFRGINQQDLAVANQTDNTVTILFNAGDGTFTPQPNPPATGTGPVAIVAGDFNTAGDPKRTGKVDLAVANKASNSVTILLNNGDGTFTPQPNPLPTGKGPVALVAADFNQDGKLDLAVVNQTANTVSVLLGNGDGTFQTKKDFATGNGPAAVTAADFNGDSRLDLAVANQTDNTISILFGNGDGTFQAKNDLPTGRGPLSLASADFNADGRPDLAVANQTDNTASILINNGFGALSFKLDVPVGNGPASVTAGDFNRDGRPDVAVANQTSNTVSLIFNTTQLIAGASSSQTPYPSAEFVDLGLKVKATPRLHPDDEVTLKLAFEIRSLTGTAVNGIPVLSNRTVDQTLRLREDETTALAGILQPQETLTITGWPGAGRAIGRHEKRQQDSELLILITPRLIRLAPRVKHAFYAGRESAAPADGALPQRLPR